jgi:hypothetical protein
MVFLLTAILIKHPTLGQTEINVQTMVFRDAAECLRNGEYNKKRFEKIYDQVEISCTEKKVEGK